MEQNVELLSMRPPVLNEYCLLEIFEYLDLNDAISFGDCCKFLRMVAHRVFKRYSNFRLHFIHLRKGEHYVNNVISHIGPQILSLEISGRSLSLGLSRILKIIDDNCRNLKCLKLTEECHRRIGNNVESTYNFESVETLKLIHYESSYATGFLSSFRRLKHLYVSRCRISSKEAVAIMQNNPNIESLCGENLVKNLQIFRNVSRLHLLAKLRLDCMSKNVNRLLRELAKHGTIEEMELIDVDVDDRSFQILTLFGRIKLLGLGYDNKTRHELLYARRSYKTLKPSTIWPSTLTALRLIHFEFTLSGLLQIIRQLNSLKWLDLFCSRIAQSDSTHLGNLTGLNDTFDDILEAIDNSTGNQRREVNLPDEFRRYFNHICSTVISRNHDIV